MDIPTKIVYSDDKELPFDKALILEHQRFLAELRQIQPNLSIKKTTLKTICTNIGRKNRKKWHWEERDIQKFASKVGERIRLMAMHTGALLRKKYPPKWAQTAFPPPAEVQNGDAVLDEAAEQDEVEDEVEDGAGTEAEEFQETMADEASGVEAQKEPENSFFEEGQIGGLLWEADDRSVAHEASMRRSPADDGSDVQEVPDTPPRGSLVRGKSSANLLGPAAEQKQQEKIAYFVGFSEHSGLAWRTASDDPDKVPEYTDDIDVHPDVSTEFATATWASDQFRHLLSSVTAERWIARKSALAQKEGKRGVKKKNVWEEGNFFILHRPQKGRAGLFFLYDKTKSEQKQVRKSEVSKLY